MPIRKILAAANNNRRRRKSMGLKMVCISVVILVCALVAAQQSSNPPSAPIPTQVLTGKSAFIANADSMTILGVPDLLYNEFYAAIKDWGRFTLVENPSDADLAFEVRFDFKAGRIPSGSGEVRVLHPITDSSFPVIRLAVIDPKTHILLWGVTEYVETANRDATARRNFDRAVVSLVNDVKKLTSTPEASSGASVQSK